MDKTLRIQLKEAEKAVATAESRHGTATPEFADALMRYSHLLEASGRKLDAVNVEARAKAIRAKLYAEEADRAAQNVSTVVIKPKDATPVGPGIYLGAVGMMIAVASLFVSQVYLIGLAVLSAVLAVSDLVMTRGGGWWRAMIVLAACGSAFACVQSVPANMLIDATPMERFNYSTENPTLVENVRALGDATTVAGYKLALPEDYSKLDQRRVDDGDVYMWQTPPRDDASQGTFEMMLLNGDSLTKHFSTFALTRVASEIALPRIGTELNIAEITASKPHMEELNGIYFATMEFKGKDATSDAERKKAGVAYVAKERNKLLVLVAADYVPQSDQTIPQMEAIVYTFTQAD